MEKSNLIDILEKNINPIAPGEQTRVETTIGASWATSNEK